MKAPSSEEFKNLGLTRICPNPWNQRTRFSGQKFDDLVASIRQKGVLQPILVRPIADGPKLVDQKDWPNHGGMVDYEIVAGERRFRASYRVACENGGPAAATIPAMIKALSDDEAFEATTIENAQREDLTELEEARNFQMYLDRKGVDAIEELADRTGIHPTYIRRRVRVLSLPKKVLEAWDKGKLKYGHLEHLCRLKGHKEINEYCKMIEGDQWSGPWSVRRLKERIDNSSPALSGAFFDIEQEGCLACPHNSDVQQKLFAVDEIEKAHCDSPKCFKQRQNNWLTANWSASALRKKYRTNGFVFDDAFSYQQHGAFHGAKYVFAECKACEHFVTVIRAGGDIHQERACLDRACMEKLEKQRSRKKSAPSGAADAAGDEQDQGPRVAWHGEHFREIFYQQKIRERTADLPWEDPRMLRLMLFGVLCHAKETLAGWFARRHGMNDARTGEPAEELQWFAFDYREALSRIIRMDINEIWEDLGDAAVELVLSKQHVTCDHRRELGDLLGIDLLTEWRISEEYLEKKTTGEMLTIGMLLGIFDDPEAQAFLKSTLGRKSFHACKKAELVRVFLESGADLAGKVPEEILAGRSV